MTERAHVRQKPGERAAVLELELAGVCCCCDAEAGCELARRRTLERQAAGSAQ